MCVCVCVCVCVQVAKLLSELDIVRRNIDIMSEVMTENEPGKESPEDFQLLEVTTPTTPGWGVLTCPPLCTRS